MAWLNEIGAYLVSQSLGVPIRLGNEPDTPDRVITIIDSPARGIPTRAMGPTLVLPSTERPRAQLRARSSPMDYEGSRILAASALLVLDWLGPITLSGVRYLHIEALQRPVVLFDRDLNDRYIYGFNFEMVKVPS